jgi:glutathione S-transferase
MKLYYHPVSTVSRPVVLFAADSGIALDYQVVDLMTSRAATTPPSTRQAGAGARDSDFR